jgi:hypothetical protein
MKSINKMEFESKLFLEYSMTPTPTELGVAKSEMELFMDDEGRHGCIEWCYELSEEDGQDCVGIGLWFDENKILTDYDGVFSLNEFAIKIIRDNGYIVPEDFE